MNIAKHSFATNYRGNPKIPVHRAGNDIDFAFISSAYSRQFFIHILKICFSSPSSSPKMGHAVCTTCLQNSLPGEVTTASPFDTGPYFATYLAHSYVSWYPAVRDRTPAIPPAFTRCVFASFTIMSVFSPARSPCTTRILTPFTKPSRSIVGVAK